MFSLFSSFRRDHIYPLYSGLIIILGRNAGMAGPSYARLAFERGMVSYVSFSHN
jgi:hypothetical protein